MNAFETRPRYGPLPYVFGGILGVCLGLLIVSGVLFFNSPRSDVGTNPMTSLTPVQSETGIDLSRSNAIVAATKSVAPSVVNITATRTQVYRTRTSYPREWLDFFGIPKTYKREISSLGSGVVVASNGYILTNEHVIIDAEKIEVTLTSGETVEAQVVDTDHNYDLAIIKIDNEGLVVARLGDSDEIVVGEWAIAIGQPFGQLLYDTQPTVTVGVISALHRDVKESQNSDQYFEDMIQTDAAINPGNSGGPLVNSRGEVIGVNTFIFSARGGGNLGIGFAIPINRGKWVLAEVLEHGRIRDVWLGIRVHSIRPRDTAGLNLKINRGLLVGEIDDESPAAKADMRPGDLIVAVNGANVRTRQEANRIIYGARIGEELRFEIMRKGKIREVVVILEEKPEEI